MCLLLTPKYFYQKSNIPIQVVEGNRVLSSVEEVLTKWKNDFAGLLAETPSSRPAEQVEKFPRNEKHDSTTPGKLLDRCWETTASLEEVKFATIAQKIRKLLVLMSYLQRCSKRIFAVLFLAPSLQPVSKIAAFPLHGERGR